MRRMMGVIAALSCALLIFSMLAPRPVEAKRPRWAWVPGGDQSAPLIGATTFARQWDIYAAADTISAVTDAGVIGAWPYEPDGGTLLAAHTDGGLSAGYQSSAGLAAAGIGTRLVNQGISLNGAIWRRSSLVNVPGYSGNGWRSLARIIFVHEAGASGTAGVLASIGRSGVGTMAIYAHSTTQFRVTLQSGTTYSSIVTAPQGITTGPHVLDVFTTDSENNGTNERLNSAFFLDGVFVGGAEHTGDMSAWTGSLADQFAVGGTTGGATPVLGRSVFFVGFASGANLDWYRGYETTYEDCVSDGLCPNMGAGASRGTGRGLIQGDGGILNIVQPSGLVADGRTRTGWAIAYPATYDGNTPVNVYYHFCGCTWTGATCRGSFTGGSAATTEPNTEVADPTAIHVYADAQYADPSDCAGGVGWMRGETTYSDFQLRYVDAINAYVRQNYAVRSSICVGRSNGGGLCEWLAYMRPALFSCVGSTLGYYTRGTSTTATGRTPTYLSHNANDPTVAPPLDRIGVPRNLEYLQGIDAGSVDGSVGWCLQMDAGGLDGGQIVVGCGCGATQGVYDGGPGVSCLWPASNANTAALDGGAGRAFMYSESTTGQHSTPNGEGRRIVDFCLAHSEDAGG